MPSIEKIVKRTEVKINGSNIGKDKTGYNVPLAPAFAIIAAIIVEDTANPILPSIKEYKNRTKLSKTNASKSAE